MEMLEEDIPPEEMWHDPDRLEEWFEAVKQRRETGMDRIDDGPDEPMVTNEYAETLKGA